MWSSTAAHHELTKNTKAGEKINADLMVWAVGIKAPDFMQQIGGLATNQINQLVVKPTL